LNNFDVIIATMLYLSSVYFVQWNVLPRSDNFVEILTLAKSPRLDASIKPVQNKRLFDIN